MPASPERKPGKKLPSTVPLFLVPAVIQDQIKQKGKSVVSISVVRKNHHQYKVRVNTFAEHVRIVRQKQTRQTDPTVQDVLDV